MARLLRTIRNRVRAGEREPCFVDPAALAVNFSFVLHEPSNSPGVADHLAAAGAHARRIALAGPERLLSMPLVGAGELAAIRPTVILTASLGVPLVLQDVAGQRGGETSLVFADRATGTQQRESFFRAPAALNLPGASIDRIAVAAALMRPGDSSLEIATRGPYRWPGDRETVLNALEDLIRDFLLQWHPPRALWNAPVELVLPEFRDSPTPEDSRPRQ